FFLSSNMAQAIAYDGTRDVTVCLTRHGVWELADNTWTKKGDAPGVPDDWHNDCGGIYAGGRCVFWIQEGRHYKYVLFAWDGSVLTKVRLTGLPDLCAGFGDPCALFAAHPDYPICQIGGETYRLEGSKWLAMPATGELPPKIGGRNGSCRPRAVYDP